MIFTLSKAPAVAEEAEAAEWAVPADFGWL